MDSIESQCRQFSAQTGKMDNDMCCDACTVDSHDPDDTFPFNDEMASDDEPLQMLTSEETQLVGKGAVNSVCTRESSPTGKICGFPGLPVVNEGKNENSECVLNRLSNANCLGLHVSNNPLKRYQRDNLKYGACLELKLLRHFLTQVHTSL